MQDFNQLLQKINQFSKDERNQILFDSLASNKPIFVELAILLGADVTIDNNYAIRWASENGHTEVVKQLIEAGANSEYISHISN